jgi:predicted  nucleic acid-binding Zn-ribbon protein
MDTIELSKERKLLGITLNRFAWAVEVLAVAIGLSIALMQAVTTYNVAYANANASIDTSVFLDVIISALPFVMVSVVELTKIPFTQVVYATTNTLWKSLFAISLLFLAFITFESAFNGFERFFSNQTRGIDTLKKELVTTEEEIKPIEEHRFQLATLTVDKIETQYNKRQNTLSKERSEQAAVILGRTEDLRASIQTEYVTSLQEQLADKRQVLGSIRADLDKDITRIYSSNEAAQSVSNRDFESQRRNLQLQLKVATEQFSSDKITGDNKIENAGFFRKSEVERKVREDLERQQTTLDDLRQQLNALDFTSNQARLDTTLQEKINNTRSSYGLRVDTLNSEIRQLSKDISKSLGSKEKGIESQVDRNAKELAGIDAKFTDQRSENDRVRDNLLAKLKNNENLINDIDLQLVDLQKQRIDIRTKINKQVGDNQVYRMAQWWYSKESAADLDRSEVSAIAVLWFGSLGVLVAITGILLAFASCVILDNTIKDKKDLVLTKSDIKSSIINVINSIRRYLIYRRRLIRAPRIKEVPKEVIKEIPVDKVVIVEKPVEIVKRELVHVPFYTNDEKLLKMQTPDFPPKKG